jgi:hypothetical protein
MAWRAIPFLSTWSLMLRAMQGEYLYKAKVKAIKDALFVIVFSFVLSKF